MREYFQLNGNENTTKTVIEGSDDVIVSVNTETIFRKSNIHFWQKPPKSGHGRELPQPERAPVQKLQLTTGIMEKTERLTSKIRNKTMMFIPTTYIQHCVGISGQCNKVRKRNKSHPD